MNKMAVVCGYIDLTNLAAGDELVQLEYIKILPAGGYIPYQSLHYRQRNDVLCYIHSKPYYYGIKFTIQQILPVGGPYKSFDYTFYREI